jgi:ribosome-binding protein aMBF1 (putative translation factor)
VQSLLPQRIEGVQTPRNADERTLRMCFTEQDAIAASIVLSGLTYREIAARMGKSKTLVNAIAKGERGLTDRNTAAFCNATGTNLVRQFRDFERARRIAAGTERNRDRIAQIASYSQVAA